MLQYQAPLVCFYAVLVGRPLVESRPDAGILANEQSLRHVTSQVHLLHVRGILGVTVPMDESGVDGVRILQHKLLDGVAFSRGGVPDLVKLLKEREPRKYLTAAAVQRCRAVREPLC